MTKKLGRKFGRAFPKIDEIFGGGEKAKPHSTREGRVAASKRTEKRLRKQAMDTLHDLDWAGPEGRSEKGKPHSTLEGKRATGRRNFKRVLQRYAGKPKPLRAKKSMGGIIKILRKLGKEIKKQPLPEKTKDLSKEFNKAFPHHDKKGKPRVKKRGGGLSQAQQHYLQHGYGPHKSSGKVLKGKKIGIQIK